jgi:hypothetical protein
MDRAEYLAEHPPIAAFSPEVEAAVASMWADGWNDHKSGKHHPPYTGPWPPPNGPRRKPSEVGQILWAALPAEVFDLSPNFDPGIFGY